MVFLSIPIRLRIAIPMTITLLSFFTSSFCCHAFLPSSSRTITRTITSSSPLFEINTKLYQQPNKNNNNDETNNEPVSVTLTSTSTSTSTSTAMDKIQNLTRRDAALLLIGGTAYTKLAVDVLIKIRRGEGNYPPDHENRTSDTFDLTLTRSLLYHLDGNGNGDSNTDSNTDTDTDRVVDDNLNMNGGQVGSRPLRVLEVGIGSSCRTFMRGMYDTAIENTIQIMTTKSITANSNTKKAKANTTPVINGIDFYGVDIEIGNEQIINNVRGRIKRINSSININNDDGSNNANANDIKSNSFPISLNVQLADITKGLPFPDGYFDAITSSLVLCSVQDQKQALHEIKRVLNPNGGTYGFIEHVAAVPVPSTAAAAAAAAAAVNDDNNNNNKNELMVLDYQQQFFDPLQQLVSHNCHLHRDTDFVIQNIFFGGNDNGGDSISDSDSSTTGTNTNTSTNAKLLQSEQRFIVKDMWPVSCQSRGVIQLG